MSANQEGTHHDLHHSGALDERGEEVEEDLTTMHRRCRRAARGRGPEGSYGRANNRELTQNEVDQVITCCSICVFSPLKIATVMFVCCALVQIKILQNYWMIAFESGTV